MTRSDRSWVRWLGSGLWAISDQGLFAVSNFALNLLLARWLPPREYGAFALAYSVFLLLGTAHSALLTEPLLIFGSARYADRFTAYLNILLRGHGLLMGGCALMLALAGVVLVRFHSVLLGGTFLALSTAAPFIPLTWLLRRACYAVWRPRWASAAGILYLVLMLLGTSLLYRYRMLSVVSALTVVSLSSLTASLWLAMRFRVRTRPDAVGVTWAGVLKDHWSYGRWAVGSSALSWMVGSVYYVVVPVWGGLEAAGALRALTNLLLPIVQTQIALSGLLIPALVRARGQPQFGGVLRSAAGIFALASLVCWASLSGFDHLLVHWLYNGRYDQYSHLLGLFGALPLLGGMGELIASALRALERPDLIFWGQSAAAAVTLSAGVWAVATWGVAGVAVGNVLSLLALLAMLCYSFVRVQKRTRVKTSRPARAV